MFGIIPTTHALIRHPRHTCSETKQVRKKPSSSGILHLKKDGVRQGLNAVVSPGFEASTVKKLVGKGGFGVVKPAFISVYDHQPLSPARPCVLKKVEVYKETEATLLLSLQGKVRHLIKTYAAGVLDRGSLHTHVISTSGKRARIKSTTTPPGQEKPQQLYGPKLYIYMEDGGMDLYDMSLKIKLDPKDCLYIAKIAAESLADLHQQGYVLGDLKANNLTIKCSTEGVVSIRLIDLGKMKPIKQGGTLNKDIALLNGTHYFSAPEIVQRHYPVVLKTKENPEIGRAHV